jgi:hypothetical protein
MSDKKSEIIVKASMCEGYILDDITLREVSLIGNEFNRRLFIKLDGTNNKSNKREQIEVILSTDDSEQLAVGINEVVKQGLFK